MSVLFSQNHLLPFPQSFRLCPLRCSFLVALLIRFPSFERGSSFLLPFYRFALSGLLFYYSSSTPFFSFYCIAVAPSLGSHVHLRLIKAGSPMTDPLVAVMSPRSEEPPQGQTANPSRSAVDLVKNVANIRIN